MPTLEDLHVLPADMRVAACAPIFDALKVNRGRPVSFDGSEVLKLDTMAAQLFVMAAKTWENDEQSFQIVSPSDPFLSTMERLGLSQMVKMEGLTNDN
jgi:anti-anti-sigma regulatory factor